jgi:hypothetical protein
MTQALQGMHNMIRPKDSPSLMKENRKMFRVAGSLRRILFLVTALVAGAASSTSVRADDGQAIVQGILDLIIGVAQRDAQQKALNGWKALDGSVIACIRQIGIEPNDLIQKGVGPEDRRVRPYVEKCQQYVAIERQRQADADRQRVAAEQAERDRLQQEADERQREVDRVEQEQAERTRAAKEARIKDLESRFPKSWVPKILEQQIEKGWTKDAVRESWGAPSSMVRTPDGSELWMYGSKKVIFVEGKVSYFGT